MAVSTVNVKTIHTHSELSCLSIPPYMHTHPPNHCLCLYVSICARTFARCVVRGDVCLMTSTTAITVDGLISPHQTLALQVIVVLISESLPMFFPPACYLISLCPVTVITNNLIYFHCTSLLYPQSMARIVQMNQSKVEIVWHVLFSFLPRARSGAAREIMIFRKAIDYISQNVKLYLKKKINLKQNLSWEDCLYKTTYLTRKK